MAGKLDRKRIITYVGIGFALALMTGLVSESVTIYKLFCAATGAAGTTGRAQSVALPVSDRTIEVRFDANIDKALPWEFKPPSKSVIVHLGQPTQVEFFSRNLSNEPVVGRALYNVTPYKIGAYFIKTQCFCFTNELLKPGESAKMPVVFYVDPKIAEDPNTSDVKTITLSYTFFRSKADGPARDLGTAAAKEQVQGKALVGASDKARARAAADKSGSYQTPPMQTETAAQQSRQ